MTKVRVGEYEMEMTYGDVRWTGFYSGGYAERISHYIIKGIPSCVAEVRQTEAKDGWEVVLFGTVVGVERLKSEAQRELEAAFSEEITTAQYATGWRVAR